MLLQAKLIVCVCGGWGGDRNSESTTEIEHWQFFLLKGKGAELHLEKCVVTERML